MKTIITILLASFACSGQGVWSDTSHIGTPWIATEHSSRVVSYQNGIKFYVNNGLVKGQVFTPKEVTFDEYVTHLLAERFREYKQKCYKGSVKVTRQGHRKECNTIPCGCPLKTSYEHRHPTFEGFMEFIENYNK